MNNAFAVFKISFQLFGCESYVLHVVEIGVPLDKLIVRFIEPSLNLIAALVYYISVAIEDNR
jgi:hypothetical protein